MTKVIEAIQSAIDRSGMAEVIVVDDGDKCLWCGNTIRLAINDLAEKPRTGACSPSCCGAPMFRRVTVMYIARSEDS